MAQIEDVLAEMRRLRAEADQRAAELAVVNSVQQALASQTDMQGIYDAVGDKIREIFHDIDMERRRVFIHCESDDGDPRQDELKVWAHRISESRARARG